MLCFSVAKSKGDGGTVLKGREIPVIVDERLREMGFGEYEGWDHIYQKPEYPIYKLFKDPEHYVADRGAESFEELF